MELCRGISDFNTLDTAQSIVTYRNESLPQFIPAAQFSLLSLNSDTIPRSTGI